MAVVVSDAALSLLTRDCLERLGIAEDDAAAVAEALVDANLRGNDSHGVARVPAYMRRIAARVARDTRSMSETAGAGPLRRLDAGAALGPAAAVKAVDLTVELARDHGISLVALGNSTHFGSAGFYARRAARADVIALVATNGPANMAPHGSTQPFLGTNAFAVAAPLPNGEQFVIDMSCSTAARGKVLRARELGEPIAPGIALDRDGNATIDAAEALAGCMLPLGGAKGTGLGLAISLAAGILAGASFDDEAGRMHGADDRPQNLGQLFCAVDPWRLGDREEAEARVRALIDRLHALPPGPGFDRVLYAGERGELTRLARLESGIPVPHAELDAIAVVCRELGHEDLAARVDGLVGSPSS